VNMGQLKGEPGADLYSQTSIKAGVVPAIAYRVRKFSVSDGLAE
jgi:hypothetical protein